MDAVNALEDRIFRAKVKSALVKAKRSGERPEVPADAPPLGARTADSAPTQPESSSADTLQSTPAATTDSPETTIKQAVQAALSGNMDPINAIEDRVLRSKAKSAWVKAKRAQS